MKFGVGIVADEELCCSIECGIERERDGYAPGEVIVIRDQYNVICTKCGGCGMLVSTKRPAVCRGCRGGVKAKATPKDRV